MTVKNKIRRIVRMCSFHVRRGWRREYRARSENGTRFHWQAGTTEVRRRSRTGSEHFARRAGAGKLLSSNVIACQLYPPRRGVERNGQLSYYYNIGLPRATGAISRAAIHRPPLCALFLSFFSGNQSQNSQKRVSFSNTRAWQCRIKTVSLRSNEARN